jgi:hypothetical protein
MYWIVINGDLAENWNKCSIISPICSTYRLEKDNLEWKNQKRSYLDMVLFIFAKNLKSIS